MLFIIRPVFLFVHGAGAGAGGRGGASERARGLIQWKGQIQWKELAFACCEVHVVTNQGVM